MQPLARARDPIDQPVSLLVFTLAGEAFSIEESRLQEVVGLGTSSAARLEWINRTPVLRLRERVIPIVNLGAALDLEGPDGAESDGTVLVLQCSPAFGILVDRITDAREAPIQAPMDFQIDLGIYLGNALVDEEILPVLDPEGLMPRDDAGRDAVVGSDPAEETVLGSAEDEVSLLIFRDFDGTRLGLSTEAIERIEVVEENRIEWCGGAPVLQYQEQLLPLTAWRGDLEKSGDSRTIVVVHAGDRRAGLVMDGVLDIVDAELDLKRSDTSPQIWGTAIVSGHATDLINADWLLDRVSTDAMRRVS